MLGDTTIQVNFKDQKSLDAAIKSISHEGRPSERSHTTITKKNSMLIINIEAKDMVALRATINGYLRILQVIEGIEDK
ncbi:hypothetical protein HZC07_03970 [Candidatus Micrarchaeota archaeon]|nr:hypothetical protein [Candidatus Micrarchaeota archaeon]